MAELAAHSLHDWEIVSSKPAGSKSDHSKRRLVSWLKTMVCGLYPHHWAFGPWWTDSTDVERRTADSKVPGWNPGCGATKIIRSFHDLLRLGLMVRSFIRSTCCNMSQQYGVLNPYETDVWTEIKCTRAMISQMDGNNGNWKLKIAHMSGVGKPCCREPKSLTHW